MLASEIHQALIGAGCGQMTKDGAEVSQFEAYGGDDLRVNVVEVHPQGVLKLFDHEGELLFLGFPGEVDDVVDIMAKYGHEAAC